MADKATKKMLSDILDVLTQHTTILKELQADKNLRNEINDNIYQRVEDMSKKFDEVLNTGIKKPKVAPVKKPTESEPATPATTAIKKKPATKKEPSESKTGNVKVIKNIMTYFKSNYNEDQTYFDSILEENQASALFLENDNDLKDKFGVAKIKAQATILYKNLSKDQKKKVREKMMDENDAASVNNDDDIEEEENSD